MFQFTREFIISEDAVVNIKSDNNMVSIEGIGAYTVGKDSTGWDRVLNFTEVAYKAPTLGYIELPFTKSATKDQKIQLRVYLHRATAPEYGNNLEAKMCKLFNIEIPAGYDLTNAVLLINSTLKKSDIPFLTVTAGSNAIKFTATDAHQIITGSISIQAEGANYHEDYWTLTKAVEKTDTGFTGAGSLGSGTYEELLHSHRLPTMENYNYFSPNKYEMPVKGKKYNLYCFDFNSGIRNIGGQGVVGQYDRSITKHLFWVATDLATDSEIAKAIKVLKNNGPEPTGPELEPANTTGK